MGTGGALMFACCRACGHGQADAFEKCPVCLADGCDQQPLQGKGTLYSFTTLHTLAEPYALGYADLPEGIRLLVRLPPPFERFGCDAPITLKLCEGVLHAVPTERAHA